MILGRAEANAAIRWPPSSTPLWRSAITTTRETPLSSGYQSLGWPSFSSVRALRGSSHPRRFRFSPLIAASFRELETATAHLRDVLGDQTYESLAREGETMTTAGLVTYAYDQIDQARAELNAVSK